MPDAFRPDPLRPALPAAAIAALQEGRKIEAIKITRRELGIDLKDAKQAVEGYLRAHPALQPPASGAEAGGSGKQLLWLVVAIVIALVAYRFF